MSRRSPPASRRAVLSLGVAVQLACLPVVRERCRLVTEPTPAPALPAGFAELDALLVRRATEMAHAARELRSAHVWGFRVTFAERTLPLLCDRLESARALALAGRTAEAGRRYQALLVASQVVQMAVALHAMAQYADHSGQPSGQIRQVLDAFAGQMEPILGAALSEDPRRIERALAEHPEGFATWVRYLEQWPWRLEEAARKVEVAKLVWDVAFLAVAAYQAAVAAAELVAAGRPPMPPLPAFATGGGAAAAGISPAASAELAEAIRKLIAAGALDAGVVVALSKTFGTGLPPAPARPTTVQMTAATSSKLSGLGNITSHGTPIDPSTAMRAGQKWLGSGYKEVAPGIFRSADGLRQFRMTNADLTPTHGNIGSHVHFEALDEAGTVIENLHLPLAR